MPFYQHSLALPETTKIVSNNDRSLASTSFCHSSSLRHSKLLKNTPVTILLLCHQLPSLVMNRNVGQPKKPVWPAYDVCFINMIATPVLECTMAVAMAIYFAVLLPYFTNI